MRYRQLTSEERYMISALRKQGIHAAEIARNLGRHRSTICREVQRNSARWDGRYRPSKAEQISGHLRAERTLSISHETIYRHLKHDRRRGGLLFQHLRFWKKKWRKLYRSRDSRIVRPTHRETLEGLC